MRLAAIGTDSEKRKRERGKREGKVADPMMVRIIHSRLSGEGKEGKGGGKRKIKLGEGDR